MSFSSGDDTEDEGDSAAVKKDRHAAAVAPAALRGISGDAKRATLHLTLPLAGTPLQARDTGPSLMGGISAVGLQLAARQHTTCGTQQCPL